MKRYLLSLTLILFFKSALFPQSFTEVSAQAGIFHTYNAVGLMGGGVVVFDFDLDGHEDIFLAGGLMSSKLYRNNGNGTYTDVANQAGLGILSNVITFGGAAGDLNNNGYPDLIVTTWGDQPGFGHDVANIILKNNGDGTFTDITASSGMNHPSWSTKAVIGDVNLDGLPDIYYANYVTSMAFTFDSVGNQTAYVPTCQENKLYLNTGNLNFSDVSQSYGVNHDGCGLAATFSDFDGDGDPDIYIANDFGDYYLQNVLLRNEYPNPHYTDVSVASGTNAPMFGMGIAIGDYDNDGDLDYYVTNIGRNRLFQNNGDGTFNEVAIAAEVNDQWIIQDSLNNTGWSAHFFDYDNDGWLDLYVTNGYVGAQLPPTGHFDPNRLFHNNGDGTFSDVTEAMGLRDTFSSRGAAILDIDNNGFLDIITVNIDFVSILNPNANPATTLFKNNIQNGNHWVKFTLQGTEAIRSAFGTRVRVKAGNLDLIREHDGGSGHASHNSPIIHFGLAQNTLIDTVEITWPGGKKQFLTQLSVDTTYHILEETLTCPVSQNIFTDRITLNSARANWTSVPGVEGYQIRARNILNPAWQWNLNIPGGSAQNQEFNGLTTGMTIVWQIRTVCSLSSGNFSNWSEPDTAIIVCQIPSGLSTAPVQRKAARLNWEPVFGSNGYLIEIGLAGGGPTVKLKNLTPNQSSIDLYGLQPGTSYRWRIRNFCSSISSLNSPFSDWQFFSTPVSREKGIESEQAMAQVLFYPNPATHSVTIHCELNTENETRAFIWSMEGKLLKPELCNRT